jgi:hypothetical protein
MWTGSAGASPISVNVTPLRFERVLTQRRQDPETQRGVNSNPRHGGVNVSQPVNDAMNALLDVAFAKIDHQA